MIFANVCGNLINLESISVIEKMPTNGIRIRYIGGYSTRLDVDYFEFVKFVKDTVRGDGKHDKDRV